MHNGIGEMDTFLTVRVSDGQEGEFITPCITLITKTETGELGTASEWRICGEKARGFTRQSHLTSPVVLIILPLNRSQGGEASLGCGTVPNQQEEPRLLAGLKPRRFSAKKLLPSCMTLCKEQTITACVGLACANVSLRQCLLRGLTLGLCTPHGKLPNLE